MSSNSSERYRKTVRNAEAELADLEKKFADISMGASEAHRYGRPLGPEYNLTETTEKMAALRRKLANGKTARNEKRVQKETLQKLQIDINTAERQLATAETRLADVKEKLSTHSRELGEAKAALDAVRKEESKARAAAVKAEKKGSEDAKALRKVSNDIEQEFKKAFALHDRAKKAGPVYIDTVERLEEEISDLNAHIRRLRVIKARNSSGGHTGGTRKLRRKNN